ncbi:putative membrane protein [Novosphingobium sp. SG751A]|nr:putative membrane protein [Novosphingobium sp. SG751A]
MFLRNAVALGVFVGTLFTVGATDSVQARGRGGWGYSSHSSFSKHSRRSRVRGFSGGYSSRGESSTGSCPCNGGNVCVGPRGGRYCITSGGNKRYGV